MKPDNGLPIAASAVWGLMFIPGSIATLFSVMFMDAPGSVNNPGAWANVALVGSFPVLCLASIALSWFVSAIRKHHPTKAWWRAQIAVFTLPLLPVATVIVLVIAGYIGLLFSGQSPGLHSTEITH